MNDVRLQAIEDWARLDTRDEQTGRVVAELVREVRRMRAELQPAPVPDSLTVTNDEIRAELLRKYGNARIARPMSVQPAAVPVFRGILDGITAADVYGVHV